MVALFARMGVLYGFSLLALAGLQGIFAALAAALMRADRWWLPLHLVFLPTVLLASGLGLPRWLWALAFVLLALVYWTSFRTQVPLFLSNRRTVATLADALPAGPLKVLDIGSGTGSFVRAFARLRPDAEVTGIEAAPAPAALATWLARKQANARLARGDFFAADWSAYDVVYAFLSPVPMAEVWDKACAEMRPGAVLVSNSFAVPGVEADGVLPVNDRRKTNLYCYTIGAVKEGDVPRQRLIWATRRREKKPHPIPTTAR
ncbi:class I SAM-dependent methyltransferase [Niveibacterium umoris]|uniref:class I SAM-dependent methyltransferase n=1 Tax=Niveibacterium umoris TaxID=1193620 RepID=UPI0030B812ED